MGTADDAVIEKKVAAMSDKYVEMIV